MQQVWWMADFDRLGSDDSFIGNKGIYLLYILLIYGILFFGVLGAGQPARDVIYFYIIFGVVMGTMPYVIDNLTKERSSIEDLDTVGIEEPPAEWLSVKTQIIIAAIATVVLGVRIAQSQSALVSAPVLGIFDSVIGNALLSGLAGVVENHVFFGFMFPTFYAFTMNRTDSAAVALPVGMAAAIGTFMAYHAWRYGFSEAALVSVAFFAAINVASVFLTRSMIISDALHFSNNLLLGLGVAKRVAFSVVLG